MSLRGKTREWRVDSRSSKFARRLRLLRSPRRVGEDVDDYCGGGEEDFERSGRRYWRSPLRSCILADREIPLP